MTNLLILYTGKSCRSQMAKGFLRSFDGTLDLRSPGTQPALHVNPKAIAIMNEVGIDLSGKHPKRVHEFLGQHWDYVITVCDHAQETCPVFTGKVTRRLHIGFYDPAEAKGTDQEILDTFGRVGDEIREKFYQLYLDISKE